MDNHERIKVQELINDLKSSISIRSEYMLWKELERSDMYIRSLYNEFARKQQEYRTPDNVVKIRDITYGTGIFPLQPAFHKLFNTTSLLLKIIEYLDVLKTSSTLDNYVQGSFLMSF